MRAPSPTQRFRLGLLGAFRFTSPEGERIEIASRKGMALIAAIAMTKDGERTRGWLQEKLWGTREPEQARSSLRRELSNLRRCLNGRAEQLLLFEHDRVKLELRYIDVDARAVLEGDDLDHAEDSIAPGEFLEGFDIPGEDGFEEWLREQRSRLTRLKDASEAELGRVQDRRAGNGGSRSLENGKRVVGVCVLPFKNMSGDHEQDYFIDGITEDIITDLGKVSSLSVISRSTARTFKNSQLDAIAIGRQLQVSHVLEGSVRKMGNRVRINAQLIECVSGSEIWADRYDRDLSDIFQVQDVIARAIVQALRVTLLPEERKALEIRATSNPEAYTLYLMARQYNATGNERHQDLVRRLCHRALELDPRYGRAWAMLSNCLIEMHRRSASDDDGWNAAERALSLDPNLAEAHAAKGAVLCIRGLFEEGLAACSTALKIDPDCYEANKHAGRCCLATGLFADAIRYFEHAASVMPADYYALGMALQAYQARGDHNGVRSAARRALERIEPIITQEPDHGRAIGFGVYALSALNETIRAKEWAARALLLDPENTNMQYNIACAMIRIGEVDMSLDILDHLSAIMTAGLIIWIDKDTDFDGIRDLPRFRSIMERTRTRLAQESRA